MNYLDFYPQKLAAVFAFPPAAQCATHNNMATSPEIMPLEMKPCTHRKLLTAILAATFILLLAGAGRAAAQTATINWTNVHQVIDGFGASNEAQGASMSLAHQT